MLRSFECLTLLSYAYTRQHRKSRLMHRNEILTRINDGGVIALSHEVRQGKRVQKEERYSAI